MTDKREIRKDLAKHDWDNCVCGSACEVCSGVSVCKKCGVTDVDKKTVEFCSGRVKEI